MIGGHKVGVKFWGSGVNVSGSRSGGGDQSQGRGSRSGGSRSETLGSDGRWGLVVGGGGVGDK